jgi:hypothetical protein
MPCPVYVTAIVNLPLAGNRNVFVAFSNCLKLKNLKLQIN